MAGFDATGPTGRGPLTGWGLGRCLTLVYDGIQKETEEKKTENSTPRTDGIPRPQPVLYRLGRGGVPCGCGRGRGFGFGSGGCFRR